MRARFLIPVIVLALATAACSFSFGNTGNDTKPASGDSEAPAQAAPEVLFSDDFSKDSSGWDRASNDQGTTDYENGEYRILVNTDNYYKWANPYKTFQDVRVEVDVHAVTDVGGDMGIICRYKDESNFYFLRVTSDGYYGISKLVDGTETLLGSEELPTSSKIKTGSETNRLRADCVGSTLTLYVNGEVLASVTDDSLTSGDVGLIAGTFDVTGNDARFDNFVVYRP